MPVIEVVENPRRRPRRRRKMSALQRRYFGKRRTSRPRRRRRSTVTRTVTTRRNNPLMASLGNPRRRTQRRTVRGYVVRRRRSNPKLFGLPGFDLQTAAWVGAGMLGTSVVPGLVRRVWPGLPSSGPMLIVVKVGATFLTAFTVRTITKSRQKSDLVMAGGLALVLVDLFRQYIAPRIGLTALGSDSSPVYAEELADIGRYIDTPMGGYVESPTGAY